MSLFERLFMFILAIPVIVKELFWPSQSKPADFKPIGKPVYHEECFYLRFPCLKFQKARAAAVIEFWKNTAYIDHDDEFVFVESMFGETHFSNLTIRFRKHCSTNSITINVYDSNAHFSIQINQTIRLSLLTARSGTEMAPLLNDLRINNVLRTVPEIPLQILFTAAGSHDSVYCVGDIVIHRSKDVIPQTVAYSLQNADLRPAFCRQNGCWLVPENNMEQCGCVEQNPGLPDLFGSFPLPGQSCACAEFFCCRQGQLFRFTDDFCQLGRVFSRYIWVPPWLSCEMMMHLDVIHPARGGAGSRRMLGNCDLRLSGNQNVVHSHTKQVAERKQMIGGGDGLALLPEVDGLR